MEVFDGVLRFYDTEERKGEKLVLRNISTVILHQNISYTHICRNISDLLLYFSVFSLGKNALRPEKSSYDWLKMFC